MLGAIAGDVIGSVYEFDGIKTVDFPLFQSESTFTDDTVLTVALADSILQAKPYVETMQGYVSRYPNRGYGRYFLRWILSSEHHPYHSYGNGAAMRISPVAYAGASLEEVLRLAQDFTAVTHDHPTGIRGAQVTAAAIFLARMGYSKAVIKREIRQLSDYDLDRRLDDIRPDYNFDETCQGTVPEALLAFFESTSFEEAIRLAVSLGGDADTLACITGSIAEPFYGGVPVDIARATQDRLDPDLIDTVRAFYARYIPERVLPV